MRRAALVFAFSLLASGAHASCASEAADRNLSGAAKASFIKKCEGGAKRASAPKPAAPAAAGGDDYSLKHKYRSMPVDER